MILSQLYNSVLKDITLLDQYEYGGDILLYVRDDILFKLIPMRNSTIEDFFHRTEFEKKESGFYAVPITVICFGSFKFYWKRSSISKLRKFLPNGRS